jgi:hypothetical protein
MGLPLNAPWDLNVHPLDPEPRCITTQSPSMSQSVPLTSSQLAEARAINTRKTVVRMKSVVVGGNFRLNPSGFSCPGNFQCTQQYNILDLRPLRPPSGQQSAHTA